MGSNMSVIDMKIDSLGNNNNPTLNNYYDKMSKLLLKKDEDKIFNEFYKYLQLFLHTYPNDINLNITNFKNDGKKLFEIITKMYVSLDIIEEINKDIENETDNDIYIKEKDEYIGFINNINYIYDNFDKLHPDLNDNSEFTIKFKETIEYLKQKDNDMRELQNTLKTLNDKVSTIANTLTSIIKKDDKIISETELMEKKIDELDKKQQNK